MTRTIISIIEHSQMYGFSFHMRNVDNRLLEFLRNYCLGARLKRVLTSSDRTNVCSQMLEGIKFDEMGYEMEVLSDDAE